MRRPQRMTRLQLMVDIAVRLRLSQERIAKGDSRIEFRAHVVDAPEVPASTKSCLAIAELLGQEICALVRRLSFGGPRAMRIDERNAEASEQLELEALSVGRGRHPSEQTDGP